MMNSKRSKILLILFTALPLLIFAQNELDSKTLKQINIIAEELNLPKPDSGVIISNSSPDFKDVSPAIKEKTKIYKRQLKELGYMKTNTRYTQSLINIKNTAKLEIESYKNNKNPYDTHLKQNFQDIKLAFDFKGISSLKSEDIIGYSAIDSWKDGWTGIAIFFNDKNLGICSLSISNIKIMHGGAQIFADDARFDINDNPNTLSIEKGINNKFLYSIDWFNGNFANALDCANDLFAQKISDKLIEMARIIDKSI